jgi:hypothetical protein
MPTRMRPPVSHPSLDEHLVRDETREEMVRGRLTFMPAADAPAGRQQALLSFVIRGHIAPGYVSSTHLLTRAGPTSEFSTSVCVRRDGIDPSTDTRHLEELAFQVVTDAWPIDLDERAEDLSNRGVRRFLAVFVERGEVAEWSATRARWIPLPPDATLDDPTLVLPVPIRALFDDAVAGDAVLTAARLRLRLTRAR